MAKAQTNAGPRVTKKVTRPGVHSKTKTSSNKGSDNYDKPYNKQGR